MPSPLRKIVLAQVALGNPAVSPDGSHALYTRRSARMQGYRRHVWIVPLDGGRARALTSGDVRDSAPQLAPQGDRVLFLRDGQVWAVPFQGGEPEQLTALTHGVSAFAHAPRGRRLALAAADPVPRFAVGPLVAGTPPLARVITRTNWRHDGDGYLDRHTHLFVQDARAGARARRLTRGDWSVESFAWSPDAARIAFCADRGERADLEGRQSVHVVGASGGEPVELARLAGSCRFVSWSPDGAHVAFLGIDEAGEPCGCEDSLWVVPAGGGSPRDLAHGRHLHLYLAGASDFVDWEVEASDALTWDGADAVIAPLTLAGRSALWRFPLAGEPAEMTGCGPHVHGYAARAGRIVTLRSTASGVVDLHLEEAGARRRLTREGSAWQRALTGIACEQVSIPGPAGPIRATVLAPRAAGRKALPLVLSIIGGPGGTGAPSRGSRTGCSRPPVHACSCPTRVARRATAAPGWRPSAATGVAPMPRISSPASTGRWGRDSPMPSAWASRASPTAAS